MTVNRKIYCIIFCFLALSCSEERVETEIIEVNRSGPYEYVESKLFGIIENEDEERLGQVSLEAGDYTSETSDDGIFDFGQLFMRSEGQILKIEKEHSPPHIRWLYPELGSVFYESVRLYDFDTERKITDAGQYLDQNLLYEFNEHTFLQNQETYAGPISFALYRHPLGVDNALVHSPISLFDSWEGQHRLFQPVELFYMEWSGQGGEDLQVDSGHQVRIKSAIADLPFEQYKNYRLFYWSETSGAWLEREGLEMTGSEFSIEIDKGTWWMIAEVQEAVIYTLDVGNKEGAFGFQEFLLQSSRGVQTGPYFTDALGVARLPLKAGQTYQVLATDRCGQLMDKAPIETSAEIIECHLNEDILVWKCNTMDCQGENVISAKMNLSPSDRSLPLRTSIDGQVSIALSDGCFDSELFHLTAEKGLHQEDLVYFKEMILRNSMDSLWICKDNSIGGFFMENERRLNIDSSLTCKIDLRNLTFDFSYSFIGMEQNFKITEMGDSSIIGYAYGDLVNSIVHEYPLEFEIYQIGAQVGDLIIGSFRGEILFNREQHPIEVNGVLRARITQIR